MTNSPAKLTPTQRRIHHIETMVDQWMDSQEFHYRATFGTEIPDQAFRVKFHTENRANMVTDIRALATYGRTERWQNAIATWAHMMETEEPEALPWAFIQYSIYAGHAA